MVHVAEWTPAMRAQFEVAVAAGISRPEAFGMLISRFGWGIPDEVRLFESAANALTLIAEDTLRPYQGETGSNLPLREMKYFRLPWPKASLRDFGATNIEMRCTLSYFVEPDPHAAARDRIERYPSHRLRFDVRRFGESHAQAQARVNELAPVAVGLAFDPVVAQPALEGVIHLVAVMLGELKVDVVALESKDLLKGVDQHRRQLPAQLGQARLAYLPHQHRSGARIIRRFAAAPQAALAQIPDRHLAFRSPSTQSKKSSIVTPTRFAPSIASRSARI
jgi:hypothetical protein